MNKLTDKKQLKDVLSRNLSNENLKDILDNVDNNEIASIYKILDIDINKVYPNPTQPRRYFDNEKLNELSQSIQTQGLITPIMVKKTDDKFMIIAGERRYRASLLANCKTIKAIVCRLSDTTIEEIALIENVQRENLNAIEEAHAYQRIIEKYDYTQDDVAKRVGKSREYIANLLRLLKLPEAIKNEVLSGNISSGHARALLSLADTESMIEMMHEINKSKLSVRATETLVKSKKKKIEKNSDKEQELKEIANLLKRKISVSKNKLSITFDSPDDLSTLLNIIKKGIL